MWKDLLERKEYLATNDVASRLLNGVKDGEHTGSAPSNGFDPAGDLDDALAKADLVCPMEADSSQLKAVARAAAGENFVLIGPPGTGKSQTIGNIIANTLAQGRTVLFVAEKRTALEVVRARLAKLGIAEFCLDLFSPKANKMAVLQQFQTAQAALEDFQPEEYSRTKQTLDTIRTELNAYVRDLHTPRRNGWTPYRGIGVILRGQEASVVRIPLEWANADVHSKADYDALVQSVEDLATLYARIGDVVVSPRLAGLEQTDWSPLWEDKLLGAVNGTLSALDTLREAALSVTKALSLPQNDLSLQRLEQIRALCSHLLSPHAAAWSFTESARETRDAVLLEQEPVARCRALTADIDTRWKDSVRTLPLADTLAEWRTVKEKWLLTRSMGQKAIRKRLEPHAIALPEDCENDLEALVELTTLLEKLANASHKTSIGPMWRGLDTNFDAINATFDWGQETRTRLAGCTAETGELLTARTHLRTLLAEGQDLLAPSGTVHASLTRYLAAFTELDAAMKTLGNCSASDVTRLISPKILVGSNRQQTGCGTGKRPLANCGTGVRGAVPAIKPRNSV